MDSSTSTCSGKLATWISRSIRSGRGLGAADGVRPRVHLQHERDGTFLPSFPWRHVHHEARARCWGQQETRAGFEGHEGLGSLHGGRLLQRDGLAPGAAGRQQHGEKLDGFPLCSQTTLPLLRLTEGEVREAVKTWVSAEDDPKVLAEEVD